MSDYKPRFMSQEHLNLALDLFRMTSVGHVNWRPTRYERMLRTVEMLRERHPELTPNGAYKDLSAALENAPFVR
jgi:hypothetical protein